MPASVGTFKAVQFMNSLAANNIPELQKHGAYSMCMARATPDAAVIDWTRPLASLIATVAPTRDPEGSLFHHLDIGRDRVPAVPQQVHEFVQVMRSPNWNFVQREDGLEALLDSPLRVEPDGGIVDVRRVGQPLERLDVAVGRARNRRARSRGLFM